MAWIEGIGDEVVVVAFLVLLFAVLLLAWKSTEVRETPASRVRFTITTLQPTVRENVVSQRENEPGLNVQNIPLVIRREDLIQNAPVLSRAAVAPPNETEELAGPSQTPEPNNETPEPTPLNRSKENVEAPTSDCELRRRNVPSDEGTSIKVKLVYLDDTSRVIETNSAQLLGDFKKQHFETELSTNKVVKLIFNGQVLNGELRSLGQLGLSDNCVVHCLIHQARNPAPPASPGPSNAEDVPSFESNFGQNESGTNHRQMNDGTLGTVDIGGLLVPLFGLVLGLVWYCRLAHATHFTAAATVALVGLSGLFIVSLIAVYFPPAQEATV